jgi:hypothetical protein
MEAGWSMLILRRSISRDFGTGRVAAAIPASSHRGKSFRLDRKRAAVSKVIGIVARQRAQAYSCPMFPGNGPIGGWNDASDRSARESSGVVLAFRGGGKNKGVGQS